ncbi:Glycosyltransferase involved in cell wall bisynthesis [Paenibacillus sp. UNCCL117]|uniref:glycosyltransferase family 4 protein n=1 Tax=unclassified Paenibacillus TaxID=185978 RepID=UPI00089233B7|nr:glycosyltransferase family 4 protein [Paenibacillus sp. UNCCL117]SDD30916.1 Glycosyltransferase involved in cell wall bisynthesis [Paenibacillus sp. cl123]SFW40243.1 Glycosyltransferase involved in cell wall bisynthesis [Paenibacillus sp. UNCCL117]
MNILLATYWPLPHLGGVWPYMKQIKENLERKGHSVDIMGNGPDIPKYHILYENREILKETLLPLLHAKLNPYTAPLLHVNDWIRTVETDRYCMELAAAYFGLGKYDVIHTQDVISTRALKRVKPASTPLVANIHGSLAREVQLAVAKDAGEAYRESDMWKYYESLEHWGALSSDVTLTSTQWMKRILVHDFAIPEGHIQTFQYGLDAEKFWNICREGTPIRPGAGKKVIICPSRLVYIKGIAYLIEALGKLRHRTDWECWIVGDGHLRHELEQQAMALGISNDVKFLGHRTDVPALLQLSDIFAHPSVQDNQPFSVMEAQLCGKPSVVSDAGGLPEMVEHGVTGFVSRVGDTGTLAFHLEKLLENDRLRRKMGAAAASWGARHWSMDLMMERLLNVYEQAILNKKREGYA